MGGDRLSFLVGGAAGLGVKTAGLIFARLCTRMGLNAFVNVEYPSIIRGGHNSVQVMVSESDLSAHDRGLDCLVALDRLALDTQLPCLVEGGVAIFDPAAMGDGTPDLAARGRVALTLPLTEMGRKSGLGSAAVNTLGLGAAVGLLGIPFESLEEVVRGKLKKLDAADLDAYLGLVRDAWSEGGKASRAFGRKVEARQAPDRMLVTGNEAVALGAIHGGLSFYSGYPMTPSSSILSFLARHGPAFDIVVKHAEDEIAAAGMAIGASYAGARAMTGTSGGGFSLMTEHLGLAAITETPLVIVESQRPGPATGLPTRTAQGDLKFVLSASQDEFPRVVLAPGDPAEAFEFTFAALNIAEQRQVPVIVLLDKHLSESYWTCPPFETAGHRVDRGPWADPAAEGVSGEYPRYRVTESGVSPRVRPGTPGVSFIASSDEHDEFGHISEETDIRNTMMAKRLRKLDGFEGERDGVARHGPQQADVTLVGWGSTKGVMLTAMARLGASGISCNVVRVLTMSPFPSRAVSDALREAGRLVLVENNATAQLGDLIALHAQVRLTDPILKFDGRQFFADELVERIEAQRS